MYEFQGHLPPCVNILLFTWSIHRPHHPDAAPILPLFRGKHVRNGAVMNRNLQVEVLMSQE